MRIFVMLLLVVAISGCKKEDKPAVEPAIEVPVINCGTSWTSECLEKNWVTHKNAPANVTIVPTGYNGHNSLLLTNPHDPNVPNPPLVRLETFIKNIKKDVPYKISFYSKIKGYPDNVNSPDLAAYVYTDGDWYGEMYYGSPGTVYHDKDWSNHSFIITGKELPTLNFELYSAYDSTWISDLKIEAL